MARQRIDASLDAFDALIAGLADAGQIAPSEVRALREQDEAPQTGQIPVPGSRWAVKNVDAPAPAASAQPMTRREARALREALEAQQRSAADVAHEAAAPEAAAPESTVASAVEAENARRTEDLIHSHRVRPTSEPKRPVVAAAPKPARGSARRSLAAVLGAVVLIPSLWIVVPATADTTPGPATADAHGRTAQQIMQVADDVQGPTVQNPDYVATAIAAIVTKIGGADAAAAAPAIVDAIAAGGERATIVETALGYIGTPYVLGGSSHTGIDCSGLTMVAYAAIGVDLFHGVIAQDKIGTHIPQSEAKPGDVVVFDDLDHIGIYLGDNQVLAAPAPGRRVSIESVDVWRPVGIHFTRLLPAGR
ncbi:C40 family peptidase [Gryllotalpicola koreensis]|uniref:NlpC/P60 domain-containing protein n=1 Tax=Gryllotalpicola koreensis TaxID=993086 RepID=A0ABP7ZTT4_9MICO